jgi:DNA invertase Pin-like site-specific DNA recombinase
MMAEAKRGRFDVLIVWSLDRFGRSLAGNVADVLAFDRAGVQLVSVREPWLDTGGRDLLLAIFSWVAEQERRRLGERTKAGLARVREHGTRKRPPDRSSATS